MGKNKIVHVMALAAYYGFAQYLPNRYSKPFGPFGNWLRIVLAHAIFKKCGKVTSIGRKAYFGTGAGLEIGDFSSIGPDCVVPKNTVIGKYVMMAPEVHIVQNNHRIDDVTVPMCFQGSVTDTPPTVIEDDCWIGVRTIFTPGHRIGRGSIVAAGSVVTKDVEPFSIVGGNPARLIRKRVE